jgi:hypothetical protein
MSEKYYTPSLEEFRVGFEYEVKAAPRIEDNDGYVKRVVKNDEKLAAINHRLVDYPIIRVKHLDKQDIELLGFKFRGRSVDDWFKLDKYQDLNGWKFSEIIMHYGYNDKQLTINGIFGIEEDVLFRGKIKNISELKQVLKMIGVEYDG